MKFWTERATTSPPDVLPSGEATLHAAQQRINNGFTLQPGPRRRKPLKWQATTTIHTPQQPTD
jgi:hypothetical protein